MTSPTDTNAQFTHDCDECVFVEHIFGHDWYVCPPSERRTGSVIARFSDDGPDYWSMPCDLLAQFAGKSRHNRELWAQGSDGPVPMYMAGIALSVFAAWERRAWEELYRAHEAQYGY